MPAAWLTRLPPGPPGVHTCVALLLQVPRTVSVPWAVPSPAVSRHRPAIRIVPSDPPVQACGGPPKQVCMLTAVPALALALVVVRQGPCELFWSWAEETGPVAGGAGGAWATGSGQVCSLLPSHGLTCSWVSLVMLAPGSSRQ